MGLQSLTFAGHSCDERCAKVSCLTRHTHTLIKMTVWRRFWDAAPGKTYDVIMFLKCLSTRRVGTEISPSKSADTQLAFFAADCAAMLCFMLVSVFDSGGSCWCGTWCSFLVVPYNTVPYCAFTTACTSVFSKLHSPIASTIKIH